MIIGRAFIISCAAFSMYVSTLSDEEEWIRFKETYGKTYISGEEERLRFKTFQYNLRKIEENHALFGKKMTSYRLGINKFADVSAEEFRNSLKAPYDYRVNNEKVKTAELTYDERDCITKDDPIPDAFDWRDRGAVTPVVDGKTYHNGYSWAFAVGGALETQVFLSIKSLMPLSVQQLIDCVDVNDAKKYYWGGKLDFVYYYIFQQGIFTEDEYPYNNTKNAKCQFNSRGILVGVLVDMEQECDIKEAIALSGTVTAVIDASGLLNYQGGIVDDSLCSNLEKDQNHSVLIVGYGKDEDFGEYWIIKNSWGIDWGEDGYFRLARLRNNTCGIGRSPSYPIVL